MDKFRGDFRFIGSAQKIADYLVVLNRPLHKGLFHSLVQCSKSLVCCDGGANELHKYDNTLIPQKIVGDMDSIKPEIKSYYQDKKVEIITDPDQDTTDYEKLMAHILSTNPPKELLVLVTGAVGGRMDHTLQGLSVTMRLCNQNPHLNLVLIDPDSLMYYLRPNTKYAIRQSKFEDKKDCGLVTFGRAEKVSTKGLRWNLGANEHFHGLEFGKFVSSSNQVVEQTVEIESSEGLYWVSHFDVAKF